MGKNLIVIDNAIVNSAYSLTLNEQRLVYCALKQIPFSAPVGKDVAFYITRDDFIALGADKTSVTKEIRAATKDLRQKSIVIKTPIGDIDIPWLKEIVRYDKNSEKELKKIYQNQAEYEDYISILRQYNLFDGNNEFNDNFVVKVVFNDKILPFLTNLKSNFTQFLASDTANFRSIYSYRFYQLMMRFKKTGYVYISVDDIRYMLMLQDKYTATRALKISVIDVAMKDINEKSPYLVKYDLKKTKGKFTHLEMRFTLKGGEKLVEPSLTREEQINQIFEESALDVDTLALVRLTYDNYIKKYPPKSDMHAVNIAKKAVDEKWLPSKQAVVELEAQKQIEKNLIHRLLSDDELLANGEPDPDYYSDYAGYFNDLSRYNKLLIKKII